MVCNCKRRAENPLVILRAVLSLRRCSLGTIEYGFTHGAEPNICVSLHKYSCPLFQNGKTGTNGTGWRTSNSSSQILRGFSLLWYFSLSRNKNSMMPLVSPLFLWCLCSIQKDCCLSAGPAPGRYTCITGICLSPPTSWYSIQCSTPLHSLSAAPRLTQKSL